MQLIKRMRVVPVDTERYLMLNGLTGAIDLIDETVYKLYLRWAQQEEVCETENPEMFQNFKQRGYLVKPHEEKIRIEEIFNQLEASINNLKTRVEPTFLLTYNCNFRCTYCYEQNVLTKGKDQILRKMNPEIVNGFFEYFSTHNKQIEDFTLYGGEPLLHTNEETIRALLHHAKEKDLGVKVITNGYTLDYYAPLLSTVKVKSIQVTLDGDAKRHNQSRYLANGEGTFEQILRGLKVAKQHNLPIMIRCNIEVDEDGQVEKVLEALNKFDLIDPAHIQLYIAPVARTESQYQCSHDFLSDYLKRIDEFSNNPIVMNEVLSKIHRVANNFLDQKKWRPIFTYCGANVSQQIFDPLGYIYPCQILVGQPEHAIGYYNPSGEIYYNDNYELWQSRNIKNMKKCRECDLALFCGGGCGMRSLVEHGNVMEGNCESMEELTKVFLPYLYKKYLKES